MGKAITVASEYILDADTNYINNTIIDGSQAASPDSAATVMFINGEDTTSVINGFTITGGEGVFMTSPWPVQCGGGIFSFTSGCTILNNKIINNHVEGDMAGGVGIASISEEPGKWIVIDHNFISNNSSEAFGFTAFGGGIAVTTNAVIKNNIIQYNSCINENQMADGGGIEVDAVPGIEVITYIFNNIIQYNEINGIDYVWGSGVSINNSQATIINNIIQYNVINGNSDTWGAGVCYRIASGVLKNNLIVNNEVNGNDNSYGGGIYLNPSTPSDVILVNNTISGNFAKTAGGGIFNVSTGTELINSILWNNSPDEIAGSFPVTYSDIMGGWSGEGNIDEDPLFAGSGDHPYSLQDASPCVNTGTPDTTGLNLPEFDLAGNPRLYGGRIEMGAYENQNVIVGLADLFVQWDYQMSVFPNPFSDQTTVRFSLPGSCPTSLTVCDITGKQIKTLISEKLTTGIHRIEWNAEGMPAGIYFLRLKTNKIVETKKLMLLR